MAEHYAGIPADRGILTSVLLAPSRGGGRYETAAHFHGGLPILPDPDRIAYDRVAYLEFVGGMAGFRD